MTVLVTIKCGVETDGVKMSINRFDEPPAEQAIAFRGGNRAISCAPKILSSGTSQV